MTPPIPGLHLAASLALLAAVAIGCSSSSSPASGVDGGNPSGCPAATPNATISCATPGLHCSYGCGVEATCSGGSWQVATSNITCDSGAPADGSATCSSSNDCTSGMQCTPGGVPMGCGICGMPPNPCSTDSDCQLADAAPGAAMVCGPPGECTCAVNGKSGSCIPRCESAGDCGPDQSCAADGHCVVKSCTTDSDCPSTQTVDYACSGGACAMKSCQTNADCGAHYCIDRTCYPEPRMCVYPPA